MEQQLEVTYYLHSGFSCALGNTICVFDYWCGEFDELPESARLSAAYLARYDHVYVFVSHSHPDHFDRVIYDWHEELPITYIVSYELPVGARGKRMNPGDELELSDTVRVKAFSSTDLGISFLVNIGGLQIFHAGDLNFWHWRDESTLAEIAEAEQEFHDAVAPIPAEKPQLVFFPVDPRQGNLYEAGANYFIMACKPRLLIPMHFWNHAESAVEFARRARSRQTEIIPMTCPGEKLTVAFEDGKICYVTINEDHAMPDPEVTLENFVSEDPFAGTDLPVDMSE